MATKTLYVLNTAAATPFFGGSMQEGGTAPTAANTSFGWTPAKTAITTPYWRARIGASTTATVSSGTSNLASPSGPTVGTGATNTTAADSFRAGPFYGTFANTAWAFDWKMRAGVAGAVGRIRMRVWRSANANGSSATELTSAAQVGATITLSTSADTNSSISWTPGSTLTFTNEYIFFQLEWEETTAGTSNTNTVLFRVGTALVTTSNFTASSVVIWNQADRPAGTITISGSNLTVTAGTDGTNSVRATHLASDSTNAYVEALVNTIDKTKTAQASGLALALLAATGDYGAVDTNGIMYVDDGRTTYGGVVGSSLATFTNGDYIGIWLRGTTAEAYKNGVKIYTWTTIPTAANLYPAADLGNISDSFTANFGATAMQYLPVGAKSWDGSRTGVAGTSYDNSISLGITTALGSDTGTARTSAPTASLAVATALNPTTGTTRVSTPTATINFSPVITPAGTFSANPAATISFSPVITSSAGTSYTNTATISLSPAMAGAANAVMPVSGSLAVTSAIAAVGSAATTGGNALSPTVIFQSTLSNGNLTVACASNQTYGVARSVNAYSTGKHYFEIHADNTPGGNTGYGICNSSTNVAGGTEQGGDTNSGGIYGNGYAGFNNVFYQTTDTLQAAGETYMLAYDADNKRLYFGKNGTWAGMSLGACDPAAGTGYLDISGMSGAGYLIISLNPSDQLTVNFGASNFAYTPPTGFSGDAGSPTYDDSITLASSPAIAASALKTSVPSATLSLSPVITPTSVQQGSSTAALAVATAETPTSTRIGTNTAALNVSPAIAAAGGLSFSATATISFSPVATATGLLNLTGAATLTFSSAITPAGTISSIKTATLSFTSGIAGAGSILANVSGSLAVATAITATAGFTFLGSATLALGTGLSASGNLLAQAAASLGVTPAISSSVPSFSASSSATLAVASGIIPTGRLNMNALASNGVVSGVGPSATFSANLTAVLALVSGLAGSGNYSALVTTSLAAITGISATPGLSSIKTATLALTAGINGAAILNATSSASIATTIGIASLAGLIASASATLAVSPTIQASTGGTLYNNSVTLAVSPAIAATAQTNMAAVANLAAATGLSASAIETILASASLAVATAMAPSATDLMAASVTIDIHPTMTSAGGNAFTSALSFALTSSVVAAVAATMSGSGTLAAVAGLSVSAVNRMTGNASIALAPSVSPSAASIMTAAATIGGTFGQQAVIPVQGYTDTIALAATTALVTAGRLDAKGAASVSAVISELTQSAAVMSAVGSLSSSIAASIAGALSLFQNMTVATSAGTTADGRTTVNGSIGFGAAAGSAVNVNLGAAGRLSFAATYGVEPRNVLTGSNAVTIAASLLVRALLSAEHPLAEVLSVNGIWQGELDLAGIYGLEQSLDGIWQGEASLAGVHEAEAALEGVVQMTVSLDGRA